MRTATRCLAALIATAAVVALQPLMAAEQAQKSVPAPVKAVADAYVKAVQAGDAKAVAMLYAEDAVEMPPNRPIVRGRAAIQQYYENLFKATKVGAFTLTHVDSHVGPDFGHDVGTYRQSVTPSGGKAIDDSGKYTVILRKIGNDWKVMSAIYNSDQPGMK